MVQIAALGYGTVGSGVVEVLEKNKENALNKKTLEEMKKEYENSYYAAFGVKNDIAKRVVDYRSSQMFSELLVQDTILCAASIPIFICSGGIGLVPALKIAGMQSAADFIVYAYIKGMNNGKACCIATKKGELIKSFIKEDNEQVRI